MRLYLDTNILVFLITGRYDELDTEALEMTKDYSNTLLASSAAVCELIHLCQIGKIFRKKERIKGERVPGWCEEKGINIVPVSKAHIQTYSALPIYEDHRDPTDRLIVAQAISDRIPLISSDSKFSRYNKHGLELVYNKR